MYRRNLLKGLLGSLFPFGFAVSSMEDHKNALSPTRYIDTQHPTIRAAVDKVAPATIDQRERAVRIHDFVRDQIKFGWSPDFYDQRASEVLKGGVGYCNTKGTLFTAMLRAAKIPARQHFVDINAAILSPYIDPGTPYVDHSFVEIYLDEHWFSTDSYIVDRPLHSAALRELRRGDKLLGFGIHRDGTTDWDGQSDSFSQFVRSTTSTNLFTRDYGVFEDVGEFYASGNGVNKLSVLLKLSFGFFARGANRRIDALRAA